MRNRSMILPLLFVPLCISCGGGGSSSSDGMVIQGTLIQGAEVAHAERLEAQVLHSASEPIENVEICALGECSRTDASGQWGFALSDAFTGGDVLFSIDGHGIADELSISIPQGAREVMVELENGEGAQVHVHEMIVDGVSVPQEHGEE